MSKKDEILNTWVAIIAGGRGTRLFPHSHDDCPKQFCLLDDENTFIQATAKRFLALGVKANRIVVVTTNSRQTQLANEQLTPLGIISPNIYQILPSYGYAGSMAKAAEFIHEFDNKAIIINTPSDQYIDLDDDFIDTMKLAIHSAAAGQPTIIGVKINDLVTFSGCGHAVYDPEDQSLCRKVIGFVEKPDKKTAMSMMRTDNSACNTGINVWAAEDLLKAINVAELDRDATKIAESGERGEALGTDELMASLGQLRLATGTFAWYDCGTLKALYAISNKTPNHKNATLGKGYIERTDCRSSLFITLKGVNLWPTNVRDAAVVLNEIGGKIFVAVVALEESQLVRELAEDFQMNENILSNDYSVKARNNIVTDTNFSDDIRVGFVGVTGYIVTALKKPNGDIDISVSRSLTKNRDIE